MKLLLMLCLILSQSPAVRQPARLWHAATYRGLTVGKSRRADMTRVFGKPKWSRPSRGEAEEDSKQEVSNSYEGIGEFPGQTIVVLNKHTGIITRIDFYPAKLTKEQAIAHFGRQYLITNYNLEPCEGDEDSEHLYESPSGPLVSLEYRRRGIAMSLGHNDMVTKLSYVGGPIGSTRSRCK